MGYKQSSRTNGLNRIEACMNMAYLCFESLGYVFNLWQFPYLVKSPAVILMLSWFLKNVHNSLSVNWKQNFLWKKKSNGHWQFRTLHWSPELSRTPQFRFFFFLLAPESVSFSNRRNINWVFTPFPRIYSIIELSNVLARKQICDKHHWPPLKNNR